MHVGDKHVAWDGSVFTLKELVRPEKHLYEDEYWECESGLHRTACEIHSEDGVVVGEGDVVPKGVLGKLYAEPAHGASFCYVFRSLDGKHTLYDELGLDFFGCEGTEIEPALVKATG